MAESDSPFLDKARASHSKLEEMVRQRQAACDAVSARAMALRISAQRLFDLDEPQTDGRRTAEHYLWGRERELKEAMEALNSLPSPEGMFGVEGSGRFGYSVQDTFYGRARESERDQFWAEIHALEPSVAALNDNWGIEKANKDSQVALDAARNAIRQSSNSFSAAPRAQLSPGDLVAAIPFLAFLLVALAGLFLAPTGVAVWIAIAFLVLTSAAAAVAVLERGPTAGTLAGVGAASSLAVFSAAYLTCRTLDANSVAHEEMPIAHVAEACFASLTVGVTGGTIGIDLGGAARVVAFVQILLTLAAVATAATIGWRSLSARIGAPPEQPAEQPRG